MNRRLISIALFSVWLAIAALFFSVVLGINATEATSLQKNLFFILGAGVITGLCFPLSVLWNRAVGFQIKGLQDFLRPLRQAFLIAFVFTVCAYLASLNLFRFTDGLTISLAALLLEFFFQANYRNVASRPAL